jgi:hypothetical protein
LLLIACPREEPIVLLDLKPEKLRADCHHPKDDHNLNDLDPSVRDSITRCHRFYKLAVGKVG